jgi:hypothetical protein
LKKIVLAVLVCSTMAYASAETEAAVGFLDKLLMEGVPAVYGEILSVRADNLAKAVEAGGDAALIARNNLTQSLNNINNAVGILTGVMNTAGNAWVGKYDDAAIEAAITTLGYLVGTDGGKSVLQLMKIGSTAHINGIIVAFKVWQASDQAVRESKNALMLEGLYYSTERLLRKRDRKLGEGDPIPLTRENVEIIWNKLVKDEQFREQFRVYLADELQRPWPKPGFWASLWLPSDYSEEKELEQRKKEFSNYIGTLIVELNKAAKREEQRVILENTFMDLKRRLDAVDLDRDQVLARFENAVRRLDKLEADLPILKASLERGIKEKDCEILRKVRNRVETEVKETIRWIPEKGPYADRRKKLYSQLKQIHNSAVNALKEITEEIKVLSKAPKVIPPKENKRTPFDIYQDELAPIIDKYPPFDCGGFGDPQSIKPVFESFLKKGQFKNGKSSVIYSGPKPPPYAELIIEAWEKENYEAAFNIISYSRIPDQNSSSSKTIEGYYRALLDKFYVTGSGHRPDSLSAIEMARQRVNAVIESKKAEHDEIIRWFEATLASYEKEFADVREKAEEIENHFLTQFHIHAFSPSYCHPDARPDPSLNPVGYRLDEIKIEELKIDISIPAKYSDIASINNTIEKCISKAEDIRNRANRLQKTSEVIIYDNEIAVENWDKLVAEVSPHLDDIRSTVDSLFMQCEVFNRAVELRNKTFLRIDKLNKQLSSVLTQAASSASDLENTASSLTAMMKRLDQWIENAVQTGLLAPVPRRSVEFKVNVVIEEIFREKIIAALVKGGTQYHYITESFKNSTISKLKSEFERLKLNQFGTSSFPALKTAYDTFIKQVERLPVYPVENFVITQREENSISLILNAPVTFARLEEAENALQAFIKEPDEDTWGEILGTQFVNIKRISEGRTYWNLYGTTFTLPRLNSAEFDFPLGQAYMAFYNRVRDALEEAISTFEQNKQQKSITALNKLNPLLSPLEEFVNRGKKIHDADISSHNTASHIAQIDQYLKDYNTSDLFVKIGEALRDINAYGGSGSTLDKYNELNKKLISIIENLSHRKEEFEKRASGAAINDVKDLYARFAKAYENMNEHGLYALLSNDWSSQDGSTILDLEEIFRRNFRVFDQISYKISNLNITPAQKEGQYYAQYDLHITSRINRTRTTHEEKSTVRELVGPDKRGKLVILKTLIGQFWY